MGGVTKGDSSPNEQHNDPEFDRIPRPPVGTVTPIRDVEDIYVFRFEVGPAILAQLLETLRRIPREQIETAVEHTPYPGFYQLFHGDQPKYIGKTSRPIRARLREHLKKLSGRVGIRLDEMSCKYAFVEDPSLVDVSEKTLIDFFSEHGLAAWNKSGFGSKVTGYGRGKQQASDWATQFPPDETVPIRLSPDSPITLQQLYEMIRKEAPLPLSIPTKPIDYRAKFLADHEETYLFVADEKPFNVWVEDLEERLADGWELERQPGAWYIVKRSE